MLFDLVDRSRWAGAQHAPTIPPSSLQHAPSTVPAFLAWSPGRCMSLVAIPIQNFNGHMALKAKLVQPRTNHICQNLLSDLMRQPLEQEHSSSQRPTSRGLGLARSYCSWCFLLQAAALCGKFHYGVAFGEPEGLADKVEDISATLVRHGFSYSGKDFITSGISGEIWAYEARDAPQERCNALACTLLVLWQHCQSRGWYLRPALRIFHSPACQQARSQIWLMPAALHVMHRRMAHCTSR